MRCGAPAPGFGLGFDLGFGAFTTICGSCVSFAAEAAGVCRAGCCTSAGADAGGVCCCSAGACCCCCDAGGCCALAPSAAAKTQSAIPLGSRTRSTHQRASHDTDRRDIRPTKYFRTILKYSFTLHLNSVYVRRKPNNHNSATPEKYLYFVRFKLVEFKSARTPGIRHPGGRSSGAADSLSANVASASTLKIAILERFTNSVPSSLRLFHPARTRRSSCRTRRSR